MQLARMLTACLCMCDPPNGQNIFVLAAHKKWGPVPAGAIPARLYRSFRWKGDRLGLFRMDAEYTWCLNNPMLVVLACKEKCFARRDIFGMRPSWRSSDGILHRGEPQAAGSGSKGPEGRRIILSRHECVRSWRWTVGACCVAVGLGLCSFGSSMGTEAYGHA